MTKYNLDCLINYEESDAVNTFEDLQDMAALTALIQRIIAEEPEASSFVFTVVPCGA